MRDIKIKFNHFSMKTITVGCLVPNKKMKELNLLNMFKNKNFNNEIEFIIIDPFVPLIEQGKFDCIIHKIHDLLIDDLKMDDKNKVTNILNQFYQDAKVNNIPLIDSCILIDVLNDRTLTMDLAERCSVTLKGIKMTIPKCANLSESLPHSDFVDFLKDHNIKFPIIVKPNGGILPSNRYNMSLHFTYTSEVGNSTEEVLGPPPYFFQEFHNHCGKLYKIFIIGDDWRVLIRPSIIDQNPDQTNPIYFKSNNISKINAKSNITSTINYSELNHFKSVKSAGLDEDVINAYLDNLRLNIEFSLIGIDLIVCDNAQTYYVVDINYFPGYKELPNIEQSFYNLFSKYIAT